MTLTTLTRAAANMARATRIIARQQRLIREQRELIDRMLEDQRRHSLEYVREMEGLAASWLIHCDQPEIDLRADLSDLVIRLGHQRASLEEHVL